MLKFVTLPVAAFALILMACGIVRADDVKNVSVPAGDLTAALETLSRQAGVELIYQTGQLEGLTTEGIKGLYSVRDAVAKLLEGSSLTVRTDPSGAMLIAMPREDSGSAADEGNTTTPGTGARENSANAAGNGTAWRAQDTVRPKDRRKNEVGADTLMRQLEEIVVTGTRLSDAPMSAPITTYDSEWLARSGVATTADFARMLPQNVNNTDSIQLGLTAGPNSGLGTGINLRGLGSDSTLVLLNGRRIASAGGAQGRFVDVSAIPLSAVDRVEVLTDGASAIYGADAVAGVVNFIFRDDYTGLETELRAGSDWRGDSPEYGASVVGGTTFERLRFFGGVEYYDRAPLTRADRFFSATDDLTAFGGTDQRLDYSQPANLYSLDGGPLPGLASPVAALPVGQDGTSVTAEDLRPGELNFQDNAVYGTISPDQQRYSLFGLLEADMTDSVTFSVDGFFASDDIESSSWPDPVSAVVTANPFNPLPGPVIVRYSPANEIGAPRTRRETETHSANVSLRGDLSWMGASLQDWNWDVTGTFARDETDTVVENAVNTAALAAAVNDPDPVTAFNPFGDGSAQNPQTLATIVSSSLRQGVSDLDLYTGIVRGPLFDTPAGLVELAAGAEYREEAFDSTYLAPTGTTSESDGSRHATSWFAEIRIPLVAPALDMPLVQALELSAAVRRENYSDFGATTNPKYGIGWRMNDTLLLRASWGTSFRPPLLYELAATSLAITFPLNDPLRGNEVVPVELIQGGNPHLSPETSENFTAGFVLQPKLFDGFLIDANFFDIQYDNRIVSGLNPFALLPDEPWLGPDVIVRAEPTPEDAAASLPGRLLAIDARSFNASVTDVQGIDFQADAQFKTGYGRFGLNFSGTHLLDYDNRLTPIAPTMDVLNTIDNPVDWRFRTTASWSSAEWFALLAANHTGGYRNDRVEPAQPVDSYTTLDAQLRYTLSTGDTWQGLMLTAGVRNLLGEDPPFVDVPGGFDPQKASAFGRSWYLTVAKEW